MTSQILHSISQEPPLLRWLHSHDPDRDITPHLLNASVSYIISTPHPNTPHPNTPHPNTPSPPPQHSITACLFIPMYRRNQFILGRLYGPTSPNATALNMLARASNTTPPTTISRRFVVDLSFPTLNFLEYEWFSDGKLSVTMHCIDSNGIYAGETILLDSPHISDPNHFTRFDLLASKNRPCPTKVVMRMRFNEHSPCQICYSQGQRCSCPHQMRESLPKTPYPSPTNWESWVAALTFTRSGLSTTSVDFTIKTSIGEMTSAETLFSNQLCEIGIGDSAPNGNHLATMFLQSSDMLVSHPTADTPLAATREKKHNRALIQDISDDEDDYQMRDSVPYPEVEIDIDTLHPATPFPALQSSPIPSPQDISCDSPPSVIVPADSVIATAHSDDVVNIDMPPAPVIAEAEIERSDVNSRPCPPPKKEERQPPKAPVNPVREQETPGVNSQRITKRVSTAKRRNKGRGKLLVCPDPGCQKVFNHKGHYNEHRRCVHEKVKEHKCPFLNCDGRFFKRSDRDRHMRSKHDFTALVCSKCDATVPDKAALDAHKREVHKDQGKHVCQKCKATFAAVTTLREHTKTCKPI